MAEHLRLIPDWEDPTALLIPATSDAQGRAIDEVRGNCGLVLQAFDWALRELHVGDLIGTILGPFAGDYNAVDEMRHDWLQLASVLDAVGDNYLRLARTACSAWQGASGDSAYAHFKHLAHQHHHQAQAARLISHQLGNALQLAQDALYALATVLAIIEDILICFTPAKWLEEVVSGGKALLTLINQIERAQAIARRFAHTLPALGRTLAAAADTLGDFNDLVALPVSATHSLNAASQLGKTAETGFG